LGSETIAFDIWLVLLCVNAGLLLVDASFDTPLKTPFDMTDVEPIKSGTPSAIYNATSGGGLTDDLTTQMVDNSTLGGAAATLNPFDTVFFPLALLWTFIQFVTGAFVFEVIALFGFPEIFVFGLQGVIGILFARSIVYWIWGR
jgi:hypothetical protein